LTYRDIRHEPAITEDDWKRFAEIGFEEEREAFIVLAINHGVKLTDGTLCRAAYRWWWRACLKMIQAGYDVNMVDEYDELTPVDYALEACDYPENSSRFSAYCMTIDVLRRAGGKSASEVTS